MANRARTVMMAWSGAVAMFGLVLTGAGFAATDGISRALMMMMHGSAAAFDAPMRFAVGLMGAVTLGWGLTVMAMASLSERLDHVGQRMLWGRMMLAVGFWFAVDSTISIANGFAPNALSNTLIFIAFVAIARKWQSECDAAGG